LNSFNSIKIVLYKTEDLKYHLVNKILAKSENDNKTIIEFINEEDLSLKITELKKKYISKEVLILKEFMGRKFQKCPGSPNVICCNYYLLNTCFNCLYNCTYCFLNSYLNSYGIIQFINLEDLTELIKSHCNRINHPVRIGTGEFTDSLMFDDVTSIAAELIESTSSITNLFLEFKTKSFNIDHLANIENKKNTVLAWSVNTQRNIDTSEEGASNINERIAAAVKAQQWGFNTAFHFDPIIKYDNFIEEYFNVIEQMAEKLTPSKIIWISLGCFRYSPGFKELPRCFQDVMVNSVTLLLKELKFLKKSKKNLSFIFLMFLSIFAWKIVMYGMRCLVKIIPLLKTLNWISVIIYLKIL